MYITNVHFECTFVDGFTLQDLLRIGLDLVRVRVRVTVGLGIGLGFWSGFS